MRTSAPRELDPFDPLDLTKVPLPYRASVLVAEQVAANYDVLSIEPPVEVGRYLRRMLDIMRSDSSVGVPVSVAATVLELSEPTVRTWLERGVLEEAEHSGPTWVTATSLGEVLGAVRTIRSIQREGRLLTRLLENLEDRRTYAELAGRLDELSGESGVTWVDPEDIASLFK